MNIKVYVNFTFTKGTRQKGEILNIQKQKSTSWICRQKK